MNYIWGCENGIGELVTLVALHDDPDAGSDTLID